MPRSTKLLVLTFIVASVGCSNARDPAKVFRLGTPLAALAVLGGSMADARSVESPMGVKPCL